MRYEYSDEMCNSHSGRSRSEGVNLSLDLGGSQGVLNAERLVNNLSRNPDTGGGHKLK
jgi:hypothetical protein